MNQLLLALLISATPLDVCDLAQVIPIQRIPYTAVPTIYCDTHGCHWLTLTGTAVPIDHQTCIVKISPHTVPISVIATIHQLDWAATDPAQIPYIIFADTLTAYVETARLHQRIKKLMYQIWHTHIIIPHPYTALGQQWKQEIQPRLKKGTPDDTDLNLIEQYLIALQTAVNRRQTFQHRPQNSTHTHNPQKGTPQ